MKTLLRLLPIVLSFALQQEPTWKEQERCPVTQELLTAEHQLTVTFEGQSFRVRDEAALKVAVAEPEVMLARLAAAGEAPRSANSICPVTGEDLEDRDIMTWVGNKNFAVCCKKCDRKASGNPIPSLDRLEGRTTKQKLCPISGKEIKGNHRAELDGYFVRTCSAACAEQVTVKTAETVFATLAKQKVVLEPRHTKCSVNPKLKRDRKQFVTLGAKRQYFSSAKVRAKFLAERKVPKMPEPADSGALDFLGGSLPGGDGR